jgi:Na+/H+ antiporter NhaD/arsenite permease-like protein
VPYLLALSNSFGGNLVIIGAVSNIIVAQQARELGIEIKFWDFARLGIPVTLVTLGGLLAWGILVH